MRLWICAAALLGCGDNLGDPAEAVSGTRLKVARDAFDDGTRLAETTWFHDAGRNERCIPRRWSDGATYCTPDAGELAFTDGSCMTGLGRVAVGPTPRYFARSVRIAGASSVRRLYPAGARVAAPAQYWLQDGDFCDGPFTGDATSVFFELGSELTTDAFVRIRRGTPTGSARLGLVPQTSDDGLYVPTAIHDRTLDADCVLASDHDVATIACGPSTAMETGEFGDPQCTQRVLSISGTAIPPLASYHSEDSGCWTYTALGDELAPQPLYSAIAGRCVESLPPAGSQQFALTAPVELATLQRSREARPGARLQRIALAAEGVRMFDDALFDTALGSECRVLAGACLPATDTQVQPFFADDQCQTPLELAMVPIGGCDPPSAFAIRDTDAEVHAIAAAYPSTFYVLSTGDRCQPFQPTGRLQPYAIGPALPVAMFAESTTVIDP